MAESYYTDTAYQKPTGVERVGGAVSRTARFLGGVHEMGYILWNGPLASINALFSGIGSLFGVGTSTSSVLEGLFRQGEYGKLASTALESIGIKVSGLGVATASPFVVLAGVGAGVRVVGSLMQGKKKEAFSKAVRGVAEMGTIFLSGLTMGVGEVISLIATGKFLSTNIGEAAERLATDLVGKDVPRQSAVGTPSRVQQAAGMAPQMAQGMAPVMAMQPQVVPQPVYYVNAQPMPVMQPGMVPQMAVPAAVGTPPQPVIVQAAPNASWTQRVAPQGQAQVRTLDIQPKAANGFVQAEAARAATAQQGPAIGQPG